MDVTKKKYTNTHTYIWSNRRKTLEDNSFFILDENVICKHERAMRTITK